MIKQLILYTLTLEKRNYILGTSIIAALFLFFATIGTNTYVDELNVARIDYSSAVSMGTIMLISCLVYTASKTFHSLNERRYAIPYLMLPSSNKDKFIANMILSIGGTFVMFFIALIGADIVQALFNIATRFTTGSLTLALLEDIDLNFVNINDTNEYMSIGIHGFFGTILSVIWLHSIFTLGSTIFRNHSFLKTGLCIILFAIILGGIATGIIAPLFLLSGRDVTIHFLVDPVIMANITYYVFFIGTALGAYWLSYRRFCKKTI